MVSLLSVPTQLSSGVICLIRFYLNNKLFIFMHQSSKNNVNAKIVLIIIAKQKCIKVLVSPNPNIVVGT